MRITCPLCGPRDRREFYYYGAEDYLNRPAPDAAPEAWDNYLHLRDNPAGITRDLWYHETGCTNWLKITRNTVTHEILSVDLVAPLEPPAKPRRRAAP
jgi:sarcosine oxidase subunit delta